VNLCLLSQHSLCRVAMPLSFAIFLICVLNADVFVHEILAVHICNSIIRGLKITVGYEAIALREAVLGIACNLWWGDERAKAREGVVESLFVDHGVKVTNKELGANLDCLLLVC
jgi:hypothetical protein